MVTKRDSSKLTKSLVGKPKKDKSEVNKQALKGWLIQYPRSKRKVLEAKIEDDLSDQDINDALRFVEEVSGNGKNHNIIELNHTKAGFSVVTTYSCTFAR